MLPMFLDNVRVGWLLYSLLFCIMSRIHCHAASPIPLPKTTLLKGVTIAHA
jgi:hypothetical protein